MWQLKCAQSYTICNILFLISLTCVTHSLEHCILIIYNKEPKESAELIDISDIRLCYLLYMMIFHNICCLSIFVVVVFNKQYWTKVHTHILVSMLYVLIFISYYVANCELKTMGHRTSSYHPRIASKHNQIDM